MSYEKVRDYFKSINLEDRLTLHDTPCDTVSHAAQNIGCKEEEIAKTMSFLLDDEAIVIVCAGDGKIKNNKYKELFGKKAKMIPFDDVEKIIGHKPGGVCPFALNDNVKVYLDVSLKRFEKVYAAAGDLNATVEVYVEEFEQISNSQGWVDVCQIPE